MAHFNEFAAIDPLALVLPMSVYVIIAEKLHPHVVKAADVREAAKSLSDAEKKFVLARARQLAANARLVEEALA